MHTAVKPAGGTRFFRLDTLGGGYTEEAIKERLYRQQCSGSFRQTGRKSGKFKTYKKARLQGSYRNSRKLTGIRALYWRYIYLLGKAGKRAVPKKISPYLYEDMVRFERYVRQYRFIAENSIGTVEDVMRMKSFFDGEMESLAEHRAELYKEMRKKGEKAKGNMEYQSYSRKIKEIRHKARQCADILETAQKIRNSLQEIQKADKREAVKHEPRERSSRTNDKGNFADFRNRSKADSNRG